MGSTPAQDFFFFSIFKNMNLLNFQFTEYFAENDLLLSLSTLKRDAKNTKNIEF